MNTEGNNNTININNLNSGMVGTDQNFSSSMVNIDELLSQSDNGNTKIEINNEVDSSSGFRKLKIIGAVAGVLLLTVVSGVFVYMMYPIEFQNLGKSIQGDSINGGIKTGVIATNIKDNTDNNNILTQPQLDTGSKNEIDDLFAGKGTGSSVSYNNNLEPDDPNRLKQNIDGSVGLNNDSSLLEGLATGTNYGNGDENSKIELLGQIRAKIEIAKMNYTEAKKSSNPEAMKLIASSLAKYKELLTKVENNEIVVKMEIQDKLVEIQADVDKAKMLIQ